MKRTVRRPRRFAFIPVVAMLVTFAPAAVATQGDQPDDQLPIPFDRSGHDPGATLAQLDELQQADVSSSSALSNPKNIDVVGRGERLLPNGTTDVWAHRGYAYLGTFDVPCGDGTGANGSGVRIFDVRDLDSVQEVGFLPSVLNSRINDVKIARVNSGNILVHSNEACAGGDGGFEVYEMTDPLQPVHLASVRIDEINETLRDLFGGVNRGVHNLFLFTQGDRDYVAMQTHNWFGSFMIYELTDPANPQFVTAWGAELLCEEDFCSDDPYNETDPDVLVAHINDYMFGGFGFSQNRFLHDVTISKDGTLAYLSHWDAGLILLDISDPANPEFISQALDVENGSLDGEVNSHAAWPTDDGSIVVETEEDFDALVSDSPLSNFTFGDDLPTNTITGFGISTLAGDDFEADGNQTGNQVTIDIGTTHHGVGLTVEVTAGPLAPTIYPAAEGSGNQPKFADVGPQSGEAVWIGRACDIDPILNEDAFDEGDIAVVRRGECNFSEKLANAAELGAASILVSNNVREDTPWGGVRIWDYSDPKNPVLASTFNTVCSADPHDESCDPRGTYSVHNVIVEGPRAFFSWYSDGVIVLRINDPYNPVELARHNDTSAEFEEQNGGIQDVWGIYKEGGGRPNIYASDRNGGLYILRRVP